MLHIILAAATIAAPVEGYSITKKPIEGVCRQFVANVDRGAPAGAMKAVRQEFERFMAEAKKACETE